MDFERVLRDLVADFTEREIRYALIGGFALGALGLPRATMDIDFLVARAALPVLDEVMARRQYLADIDRLAERFSAEMDWERVREYFALFDRLELYDEIRDAHGPADRC